MKKFTQKEKEMIRDTIINTKEIDDNLDVLSVTDDDKHINHYTLNLLCENNRFLIRYKGILMSIKLIYASEKSRTIRGFSIKIEDLYCYHSSITLYEEEFYFVTLFDDIDEINIDIVVGESILSTSHRNIITNLIIGLILIYEK